MLVFILFITTCIALSTSVSGEELPPSPLYHDYIIVEARNYHYVDINADKPGTTITIIAYTYGKNLTPTDIDVQIIGPDGSLILPKQRYRGMFIQFKAGMPGVYRLMLDNSYSDQKKIVDIAYMIESPPIITTIASRAYIDTEYIDISSATVVSLLSLVIGVIIGYLIARHEAAAKTK